MDLDPDSGSSDNGLEEIENYIPHHTKRLISEDDILQIKISATACQLDTLRAENLEYTKELLACKVHLAFLMRKPGLFFNEDHMRACYQARIEWYEKSIFEVREMIDELEGKQKTFKAEFFGVSQYLSGTSDADESDQERDFIDPGYNSDGEDPFVKAVIQRRSEDAEAPVIKKWQSVRID
ncbi:hypothetical protein BD324DRAFT_607023 [Kockovaella imperatae]|uniref:Uncharacterized protein n=1 Tax=Kockovaella imperatae TaxID=4999 RepID=A0A1Y1UP22_9TREE|nr:hypothetical protein BD324DRAFT_607023 [Kockovaella imperatae]ORX39800.1 hypothetical protein BD324DRAFT_607023 [Kockovaella imperatae]